MTVSFFFSSRRRHTRLQGDWSSDVCSSDLAPWPCRRRSSTPPSDSAWRSTPARCSSGKPASTWRSEERRVGKEGRAGRSREPYTKKQRGSEDGELRTARRVADVSARNRHST